MSATASASASSLSPARSAGRSRARFQIRWGYDVTIEDRVICEGRVYELVVVKEIGRHEGQELSARARAE